MGIKAILRIDCDAPLCNNYLVAGSSFDAETENISSQLRRFRSVAGGKGWTASFEPGKFLYYYCPDCSGEGDQPELKPEHKDLKHA